MNTSVTAVASPNVAENHTVPATIPALEETTAPVSIADLDSVPTGLTPRPNYTRVQIESPLPLDATSSNCHRRGPPPSPPGPRQRNSCLFSTTALNESFSSTPNLIETCVCFKFPFSISNIYDVKIKMREKQ